MIITALLACTTAQVGGGWDLTHRHAGAVRIAEAGRTFAAVGDVDGDSCDDYAALMPDAPGSLHVGVHLFSGRTGLVLRELVHPAGLALGSDMAGAGDIDLDGIPDVLVSGYSATVSGLSRAGAVVIYSGADGSLLLELYGSRVNEQLGWRVAGGADADGDGVPDVLVGTIQQSNAPHNGHCRLYSGASGALLYEFAGTEHFTGFGFAVDFLGDWDGDGRSEFAHSNFLADVGAASHAGVVWVHSGATGALLQTFQGLSAEDRFGYSFANAGDADADGTPDLLVGIPGARINGWIGAGAATLYSGRTHAQLLHFDGEARYEQMGYSVAGAGDQDGDAHADLLIGVPNRFTHVRRNAGTALVLSGQTGALIRSIGGQAFSERLGSRVGRAGQLDGSGPDHLFVWVPGADSGGLEDNGELRAYAHQPFLDPVTAELSVAHGADLLLNLDFPLDASGAYYRILISGAGTGPTRLWGLDVPLTPDAWYFRSLAGALPAGALGFEGFLSAEAQAGARLTVPAGWIAPHLVGRSLWLAAVTRAPLGSGIHSSMACTLTIVP